MREKNRNHHPQGTGLPPLHMIYTWWILPKKPMEIRQQEITPRGRKQNMGVIGAAPSLATTILALEKKIQMVPKRNMILINPPSSKPNRNTGWLAQTNRQRTDTWMMITICLPPRMR